MGDPWTPEYELRYFHKQTTETMTERSKKHYDVFRLGNVLHGVQPEVVLEVGCGGNGGTLAVYPEGVHRYAVDPLAEHYADANPELETDNNMEWVTAYAHELPFPDSFADVIFCLEALDHCQNIKQFRASMRELFRILKPGGHLFFMVPARPQRPEGYHGHPVNPPGVEIIKDWKNIGAKIVKSNYQREGTWVHLRKP